MSSHCADPLLHLLSVEKWTCPKHHGFDYAGKILWLVCVTLWMRNPCADCSVFPWPFPGVHVRVDGDAVIGSIAELLFGSFGTGTQKQYMSQPSVKAGTLWKCLNYVCCISSQGAAPLWVPRDSTGSQGAAPLWGPRDSTGSQGAAPLWGPRDSTGSQGAAPLWGSRGQHWQSKGSTPVGVQGTALAVKR